MTAGLKPAAYRYRWSFCRATYVTIRFNIRGDKFKAMVYFGGRVESHTRPCVITTTGRCEPKPHDGAGFGVVLCLRTMRCAHAPGPKSTGRSTFDPRRRLHFRTPYKTDHYNRPTRRHRSRMPVTINVDDKVQVWEWTCPRGHRNWEPTNFHFWCAACARSHDANPSFDRIRSARDGRELSRAEIELVNRTGETIVPPRRG